ncbi:signal peptidase II [Candidatus Dojkabacteria bacterium]|nr:signal peptidase II [Candidatus Dojkabacteria bacterium]
MDQLLKYLAINTFNNFILNFGISFGVFSGNNLVIIAIIITLGIILYISHRSSLSINIIFLLGGGISNLIDRIIYGAVVDYINLFNVIWINLADVFINLAVILIIINILFEIISNEKSVS